MGADPVTERALAGSLAEVFADRGFWRELAEWGSAITPSALLIKRAVELYLATGRFFEQDLYLDPETPAARAAGLLREVADAAAVGSYAREEMAESGGEMPPRSAFAWLLRVNGVDEWASQLGHRVSDVQGTAFPDEAWPRIAPEDDENSVGAFVEAWTAVSGLYGNTLDRFEEGSTLRDGWAYALAQGGEPMEGLRVKAAENLLRARSWLGWARRNLPTDAEPLAVAAVVISQTLFVLGWRVPEEAFVPSPRYLSESLRASEALDWLTEHGGEPPEWLT